MDKHLHIVSFDVPWPADYGGAIDLFYKIKSLHKLGIKIHLHCFTKNNAEQPILLRYCDTVQYYLRKKNISGISLSLPHIIQSRSSLQLLKDLQKDNHPIFFDGIHCTYLLQKGFLKGRKVFVRPHNIEHKYYQRLADNEHNFFKKIYYLTESRLLKKYEKRISNKAVFWPISKDDTLFFRETFGATQVDFLPAFVGWETVKTIPGKGSFCLYHGNLSVNENDVAARWLLNEVFSKIKVPFVIAGKNPSPFLLQLAHHNEHTCIVANPSEHEIDDLIKKAQLNIIPSFNETGVKLKLLHSLYTGRHCLVNEAAVAGTGLATDCHVANGAEGFAEAIKKLFDTAFTVEAIALRSILLDSLYNNEKNAQQIISWIY